MDRYTCVLYFKYKYSDISAVFTNAVLNPGFSPALIDVYINNESNPQFGVRYSEDALTKFLESKASFILIKSGEYVEGGIDFSISLKINHDYDLCQITWNCNKLDFLFEKNSIDTYIMHDNFFYGYCCNSNDMLKQSNDDIDLFEIDYPGESYKTIKQKGRKVVDISENWGRSQMICGINFLAAPKMWFGIHFYKIIPKEKFILFPLAKLMEFNGTERIHVSLFDLNDSPSISSNRDKQKLFWHFFDFQKVIIDYGNSIENEIGVTAVANEYVSKNTPC